MLRAPSTKLSTVSRRALAGASHCPCNHIQPHTSLQSRCYAQFAEELQVAYAFYQREKPRIKPGSDSKIFLYQITHGMGEHR